MPILDHRSFEFISHSEEQTLRIGVRIGQLLEAGDLLCLSGDLGAGKTVLARGIGRGWGTAVRVTSPTYTIVHEYPRAQDGCLLYHLDCYRLQSEADAETIGLDDIFAAEAAVMVEWPERIEAYLLADRLEIELSDVSVTRRRLFFRATGEQSLALLQEFKRDAFGV